MKCITLWIAATALWLVGMSSHAADEPIYHRISFQVQVQEAVANDRMAITLMAEADEATATAVAGNINQRMQWALQQTRPLDGVQVSTGEYSISPVYEKGRPQRWRGYQVLRIESDDVTRLSELTGKLQQQLQVKSSRFFVSPEKRQKLEQALIAKTAQRFQARAEQLTRQFAAQRYELVSVNVTTSGPPVPRQRLLGAMLAETRAPAFEAGESDLVVSMNGVIELVP